MRECKCIIGDTSLLMIGIPWAYYLDMSGITSNYDIQYTFFDSYGNELN